MTSLWHQLIRISQTHTHTHRSQKHRFQYDAAAQSVVGRQKVAEAGAHLRDARENVQARWRRIWSLHRLAVQQTVAVRHIDGDSLVGRQIVHAHAAGTAQIDERHVEVNATDARRAVTETVASRIGGSVTGGRIDTGGAVDIVVVVVVVGQKVYGLLRTSE